MPWRFAFVAMRDRRPPLDLRTYQIHIPSPRYGLCDLPPPLAAAPEGPLRPDAAPPVGIIRARTTRTAASATGPSRTSGPCPRDRVAARGRLPAGPRLVLGARISVSTPAGTEPPRPVADGEVVSRNPAAQVDRRESRQDRMRVKWVLG